MFLDASTAKKTKQPPIPPCGVTRRGELRRSPGNGAAGWESLHERMDMRFSKRGILLKAWQPPLNENSQSRGRARASAAATTKPANQLRNLTNLSRTKTRGAAVRR